MIHFFIFSDLNWLKFKKIVKNFKQEVFLSWRLWAGKRACVNESQWLWFVLRKYTKIHWHKLSSTCSWRYFFSELIRHSVIHASLHRNFHYQCSKQGGVKMSLGYHTFNISSNNAFASWMKISRIFIQDILWITFINIVPKKIF